MLRKLLKQFGVGRTVLLVTLASVLVSEMVTVVSAYLVGGGPGPTGLLIGAIVPLIVAPLFSSVQLSLISQLEQARDELHHLSITDELTQVYNRRHFLQKAQRVFDQSRSTTQPFALVLFDIDDFKRVNDTYGHMVGDQVLRQLAEVAHASIRKHDLLARWGGEEFMLLLPQTGPDEALEVARRVQQGIAQNPPLGPGEALKLTLSIGVSFFQPQISTLDDLLRQADDALYRAKNLGKNRVETMLMAG
ncbi:MAG: GGDEF domain-containing protein [Thermaceae bacterium]|nr:GGDEF domain-containing protein [Thermaceae bacterium]